MDANQFEKILQMQMQMLEQMRMASNTAQVQVQNNTANTILVPNFDPFDPVKEPYKNYIQRFQNYIEMKGISANKDYCLELLLNSIGISTFNIITALAAQKTPAELDYDDLMQLLKSHFSPTRNILVAQHRFLTKYQNDQQTIAEFVATLRAEIGECDFTSPCTCKVSIADIFLRSQFIRGVRDNYMREQLLQAGSLKFDEIVTKALALEAAKVDARELADTAGTSNVTTDINKISKIKRIGQKRRNQQVNSKKANYEDLGIAGLCFRCGRNNHQAKECRTKKDKLKCSSCNKKGHVSKVCITSLKTNGMVRPHNNSDQIQKNTTRRLRCLQDN